MIVMGHAGLGCSGSTVVADWVSRPDFLGPRETDYPDRNGELTVRESLIRRHGQ